MRKNQNMSNFRVNLLINIKQSPAQMTCIQYGEYTQKYRSLNDKLGNGTCATVMKIAHKQTNIPYALKYAKFDSVDKLAVAFQQIEAVRVVSDNPVATQIYYYFVNIGKKAQFSVPIIELGIIMQLADRSLEQDIYLRRKKQRFFSLSQLQEMAETLINFFACFQRKGYIHRDIKPDNILIMKPEASVDSKFCTNSSRYENKKTPNYKVCDFGYATKRHEFSGKNIAGTATYASPKLQVKFKNSDVIVSGNNYKDDVFSLGVTLIEASSLQSAQRTPPNKLLLKIVERYGQKFVEILQHMIEFTEQRRPDFIRLQELFKQYLASKEIELISKQQSTAYKSFSNHNASLSFSQFDNVRELQSRCMSVQQGKVNSKGGSIPQIEISNSDSNSIINTRAIQLQLIPSVRPTVMSNQKRDSYGKMIDLQEVPNHMYESYLNPQFKKHQQRNMTPNKLTADKPKPTQEKPKQMKELITIGDILKNCNDAIVTNDRAKTKRRSKLLQSMNNDINCIRNNADLSISNCISNSPNSTAPKSKPNANKVEQQIELSLAESMQQSDATNVLFKFQQPQKIQNIEIIEIESRLAAVLQVAACLIAQDCLFVCTQNRSGAKRVTFIKFDEKLVGVKFMKYYRKIRRLFIICSDDMIHTLNMELLPDIINRCMQFNIPYAHSKQFELIQIKTQTSPVTAFWVDQGRCEVTKVLKNGQITEGRNTLAKCPDKMNIAYLRRYEKFLYVATHYGYVARYSQNSGDKVSCMMGCFDFKCTILAIEIVELQTRTGIAVVTSNGFLVIFSLTLQKLGQKQISQSCLKNCKIDFKLQSGRKVVGISANGEIVNEKGQIIKQTYIDDAIQIFVVEHGDKFIVATQSGTIYEVDMEQIEFWTYQKNRKKAVVRQEIQLEKGKKRYLQQFMERRNIPCNNRNNRPQERSTVGNHRGDRYPKVEGNEEHKFVKRINKF